MLRTRSEVRWATLTVRAAPEQRAARWRFLSPSLGLAAGGGGDVARGCAQTRCPGGVAPGSVLCQPDLPQSGSGSGMTIVKIVGHWDKTWRAIADSPNLIGGVSTGELSKQAAEQRALGACEERGGHSCVVSFTYFNECIADVDPNVRGTPNYIQAAVSIERASELGLKYCSEMAGTGASCKVVYSDCTMPKYRD
ncbi:DUF4189 domain-containing protein [Pseudoxanthomonas winnipegensis]|uniref:DUF4189 domain-containing protein n=2 Tax=Pseudoxanthomonas winnipegensis TaxID=2480810 RepID=A0ABY1WB64_9GAMM|nr:DUF4189 domain-containing protein [Pseudoxanthomonas winnipegensis]